jgi:hypothetical protein
MKEMAEKREARLQAEMEFEEGRSGKEMDGGIRRRQESRTSLSG